MNESLQNKKDSLQNIFKVNNKAAKQCANQCLKLTQWVKTCSNQQCPSQDLFVQSQQWKTPEQCVKSVQN